VGLEPQDGEAHQRLVHAPDLLDTQRAKAQPLAIEHDQPLQHASYRAVVHGRHPHRLPPLGRHHRRAARGLPFCGMSATRNGMKPLALSSGRRIREPPLAAIAREPDPRTALAPLGPKARALTRLRDRCEP